MKSYLWVIMFVCLGNNEQVNKYLIEGSLCIDIVQSNESSINIKKLYELGML